MINVQKDLTVQIKMIYHSRMDIKTYFQTTVPADRKAFADAVGASVDYLYLCARGVRKPGPSLCRRIVGQDPRFTLAELRPDLWGDTFSSQDASDDAQPPVGTSKSVK